MKQVRLKLHWNPVFTGVVGAGLVGLINATVTDGGTLGFAEVLTAEAAERLLLGLNRKILEGDAEALYATLDAEPAFFVMINLSGMPNCRHSAELVKGVVAPRLRGQHLPRAAFRALVERARALGIEQFVLDVREGTRAHALWSHYGFKTWGVLPNYARVDGKTYAGHYMAQSVEALAAVIGYQQDV